MKRSVCYRDPLSSFGVYSDSKKDGFDGIKVLQIGIGPAFGGIESFLLNLKKNSDSSLVRFDYVSYVSNPARREEFQSEGSRVFCLSDRSNPFLYFRELCLLCSQGYDVVHVHKNSAADIVPFLAAKKTHVKRIIAHAHNANRPLTHLQSVLNFVGGCCLGSVCTDEFACSELAARWLFSKRDIEEKRVRILYNGVDLERFAFSRSKRNAIRKKYDVEDCAVFGCVGRFRPQKNHAYLVSVFREICKLNPNSCLLLLGDGPDRKTVEQALENQGLADKAIFTGNVENVGDYMMAMDVMLLPSLYEGFPIVAIEAQATGLPIVASENITGEISILDSCVRVALDESDVSEWAQTALKLSRCERKPIVGEQMRLFSWSEVGKAMTSFYVGENGSCG